MADQVLVSHRTVASDYLAHYGLSLPAHIDSAPMVLPCGRVSDNLSVQFSCGGRDKRSWRRPSDILYSVIRHKFCTHQWRACLDGQ